MKRFLTYALIGAACLAAPLPAQDAEEDAESGGFLVDLLQDNLSGDNRYIKVTGLEGAFSSRATIRQLTVSDDDGVWLTVSDAVLDWNRLALVTGRFSVNTLSAGTIEVLRQPKPIEAPADLPPPEATPFQVPELPVAVEIGALKVAALRLGDGLIAGGAELEMTGALSLADGNLDTTLAVLRLDRATDKLDLTAGFQNATSQITVDLQLSEAAGGLLTQALDVPDRPPILLTAQGQGPVTDFTADLTLSSSGIQRLGGQVRLREIGPEDGRDDAPGGIGFQVDLAGDLTPLLAQDYRSFFGDDLRLELQGFSGSDGRLAVETLDVLSNALTLNAALDIAGSGQIETLLVQGRIAPPDGAAVVLPLPGPRTELQAAVISARLQAETDDTWEVRLGVDGLARPDMTLQRFEINADGTLDQQNTTRLNGKLALTLAGLGFADSALNRAVGSQVTVTGDFLAVDETAFQLDGFRIAGQDYAATIDGEIDGLTSGFRIEGQAAVKAEDLSRFSGLAGRDLGGAVTADVTGTGAPLNGTFDFDLGAAAQDLITGAPQLDAVLPGRTQLTLQAARGETGLTLRTLHVRGPALAVQATGTARSGSTNIEFDAQLDDLARVVAQMPGPLSAKGAVVQTEDRLTGTLRLDGPDDSFADLNGRLDSDGDVDLTYAAALTRIERFLPQLPGALTAKGTAMRNGGGWRIDTSAEGPAGFVAKVNGAVQPGADIILDVKLSEPRNGPVSTLLNIPDRPALQLTAQGQGPASDFDADIRLTSDGGDRLRGTVQLSEAAVANTAGAIAFLADLGGDIRPLLNPAHREFFGPDLRLALAGRSGPQGRLTVERLDVTAQSLTLTGALDMAGTGLIDRVKMTGRIAQTGSGPVLLPLPGAPTTVAAARFDAELGTRSAQAWDLGLTVNGLSHPELSLARAELAADGTLDQTDDMHLTGRLRAALDGLTPSDPALAMAVGERLDLRSEFELIERTTLKLARTALTGADFAAELQAEIAGLGGDLQLSGRAQAQARDLSRLSGLAGRPVRGALEVDLSGSADPTGGIFDIDLAARVDDLHSGIQPVDAVFPGRTTLKLSGARDASGLDVRDFRLNGQALTAQAAGSLRRGGADLKFDANLDELARLVPEAKGPLTVTGRVAQQEADIAGSLRVDGPHESFADLHGTLAPDGAIDLDFDAMLARLERFVPEFPGAITARGELQRQNNTWQITGRSEGPGGFAADIAGSVDQASMISDLTAKGRLQLALANRFITPNSVRGTGEFDLTFRGPPELASLSGTIRTANSTVAVPAVRQTIDDLDTDITLSGGQARINVSAGLRAGGRVRVTGPVALSPPFNANLVTELQQLVLTDNVVFTSSANGRLDIAGPLTGNATIKGEILIGETEININALSGSLGAAPIPTITHRGEPGSVFVTRKHAQLVETDKGGNGPDIGLDIRISAANRVFVRGRGLQAELGGNILIRGSTSRVAPSGQIGLIRGNMDILGRRLSLSKGLVSLQGNLEPYMEFAATTNTSDGVATLEIAGPMTTPKITVYSQPERPSEEALAMLIFGNQYSEVSPLRIAQMAASLAQLSGSGGGTTEKARKGLGVDTLDIGTDDSGQAKVGAGKYIAEGVYTDVSVNTLGDTELNLNLDVSETLTLKGTVDSTGDTAIGLFFERDY
ncbi:translocation/assembly module TamB domain-containing protein [Sedimentitalea sp. HM32M-2]|uniref:translocation/assembly module TamB domain-containing protein n=1 Tax=Sedimentitalea sp. HM32M-2 TaxID=3351566 RepID=UPI0036322A34